MARILIVDDDRLICKGLTHLILRSSHEVECAPTLKDGIRRAIDEPFDVVFLDVRLPDGNGLSAVQEIRKNPSAPEVIIITAAGDADGAEMALHSGAWDYIQKGSSMKDLLLPLSRALDYRREKLRTKAPWS